MTRHCPWVVIDLDDLPLEHEPLEQRQDGESTEEEQLSQDSELTEVAEDSMDTEVDEDTEVEETEEDVEETEEEAEAETHMASEMSVSSVEFQEIDHTLNSIWPDTIVSEANTMEMPLVNYILSDDDVLELHTNTILEIRVEDAKNCDFKLADLLKTDVDQSKSIDAPTPRPESIDNKLSTLKTSDDSLPKTEEKSDKEERLPLMKSGINFECYWCRQGFAIRTQLEAHRKSVHPDKVCCFITRKCEVVD